MPPRFVFTDRELIVRASGESLWRKCECGRWVSKATGEHVELVTMSLAEALKRYRRRCTEKTEKDSEVTRKPGASES